MQAGDGLAGDLPDALARDDGLALVFQRDALGDFHHIAAHEDSQLLLRAFFVNRHLDLREMHDMQANGAGILRQKLGQRQHLFFGPLAGIGEAMVVHRFQIDAAAGHHISGHGAIDAPRKQQHCLAAGAQRHAAFAGQNAGIEIGLLAHLDVDRQLWVFDIHTQARDMLQNIAANFRCDLHRT